ncbi:hypothetical protein Q3G72_003208 [Acer saccharum]|nr:hypothetical protein Q3G72_003208 [Acer saccharum]
MSPGNMDLVAKGTLVEVSSDKGWFSSGWFVAKVLDPPLSSPYTPGKMKFLVEHQSLFCYDGKFGRNCVDIKFVRPLPPLPPNDDEQEQQRFEVNDVVDAYCNDGWRRLAPPSRRLITRRRSSTAIMVQSAKLGGHGQSRSKSGQVGPSRSKLVKVRGRRGVAVDIC